MRKFDKFLKDNDAKRVRADRKVQEEKKASVQKETEKNDQQKLLNEQMEKRAQLRLEVRRRPAYAGARMRAAGDAEHKVVELLVHPRFEVAVLLLSALAREHAIVPHHVACSHACTGREQEQVPTLP